MKKIITYLIYIAIPLGVGLVSWVFTADSMKQYEGLKLPLFSPPGMVFPIAWTILYILMGTGVYIVHYRKESSGFVTVGLIMYYIQLFMNFMWSLIFFMEGLYFVAFIWIVIMWFVVLFMLLAYSKVSILAMVLNIPLILWLTYACYLNLGVVRLQ